MNASPAGPPAPRESANPPSANPPSANPPGVAGSVIVVTGAASGIGRACGEQLAAQGAAVVLTDRNADALAETAADIEVAGGRAIAVVADVTDAASLAAVADAAGAEFGALDGWVNVAGVSRNAAPSVLTLEELRWVMSVNLEGAVLGCQLAVGAMRAQGDGGSIVNVVSTAIDHPLPAVSAYAMSKVALCSFTRSLAAEVGPEGIRVNAVAPGYVATPMSRARYRNDDGTYDEARMARAEELMASVPMRRIGEPLDIASAITFLCSPASSWVTGQVWRINGGASMPA